jgi:tetratricopeptide (TPR) repeat protein
VEQETISQDDLDALLAEAAGTPDIQESPEPEAKRAPAMPPEPVIQGTPSLVQPDSLADDEDMEPLDEDDLEALIAAVDRDTAEALQEDSMSDSAEVDQNMVDSLLEEITATTGFDFQGESEALAGGYMDDPVVAEPPTPEPPTAELVTKAGDVSGPVNQDLIDALLASAAGEEVPPPKTKGAGDISQENLAAAATAPKKDPGLLSQADLDALLVEAKENDHARQRAKEQRLADAPRATSSEAESPPAEPKSEPWSKRFRRKRAHRPPSPVRQFVRANTTRIAASLLAGAMGALGTFSGLYRSQEQTPSLALLEAATRAPALDAAMRRARELMSAGEHAQAAELLEAPMAQARRDAGGLPAPALVDAEFLHAEARYRALPSSPGFQASEAVITLFEKAVESAPTHPRAPFLLHWKGRLLEGQELLSAAAAAYERVIDNYGDAPNRGEVMIDAARLALARKKPEMALVHARQILQENPDAPESMEAELLIADAYALSGLLDEARSIYVGMAQDAGQTAEGSQSYQRLGEIAMARGRYAEAAELFEQRLETATATEGNDRTYFKLAQAYRQVGRLEDARNALNDLINFFPESAISPMAFIELSQTLEGLGEQQEAVRLAQQAVSRYPENPAVLENAGDMHARAGQPGRAADLLVAADAAGAADPALLLRAGGHYQSAALPLQALKTYELIGQSYPRAPQAVRGGIEAANVLYELGQATEAVERLENIVATTTGSPHRLPALTGLARIYGDMGLHERLAGVAQQLAAVSSEPAVLAQAAQGLIEAGAVEEGMRMAERVDPARLTARDAYALTLAQGEALLRYAPRRALEKLEEAYFSYPEARTLQGGRLLLDTYLALDQRAAARRVITEMQAHVQVNPVDTPHLIDAAVAWGDHLSRIGDHREAASAYAIVMDSAERAGELDPKTAEAVAWAKYQQANAFLENYQFAESVTILDEIATSGAPWAKEASLKAGYARTELRLRGETPAPPQESR